jgi:ATP-binding cassette subfamily F protein 3
MLSKPNLLILDEPTNHLDITSREVLEDALLNYDGTLLVVSHDRYFINKLASKIVHLTHTGAVDIDGNYDTYLQYREGVVNEVIKESRKKPQVNEYKLRKEQASLERKRKSDIAKIEKEIEEKEMLLAEIEASLSTPEVSGDYEKLLECTEKLDETKTELEDLYTRWEELQITE